MCDLSALSDALSVCNIGETGPCFGRERYVYRHKEGILILYCEFDQTTANRPNTHRCVHKGRDAVSWKHRTVSLKHCLYFLLCVFRWRTFTVNGANRAIVYLTDTFLAPLSSNNFHGKVWWSGTWQPLTHREWLGQQRYTQSSLVPVKLELLRCWIPCRETMSEWRAAIGGS